MGKHEFTQHEAHLTAAILGDFYYHNGISFPRILDQFVACEVMPDWDSACEDS